MRLNRLRTVPARPRVAFVDRAPAAPRRSAAARRTRLALVALAGLMLAGVGAHAEDDAALTGTQSGLPVPRFVSLKSDLVNVRGGPTKDHEVGWVYTHAGLPVEVTAEYENWRRIRDWEGAEGWVYHSLLSGKRTAFVAKAKGDGALVPIHETADPKSAVTANLEPGVLGSVKRCTGKWCRLIGKGFDGWIPQERLWGVYPNEILD